MRLLAGVCVYDRMPNISLWMHCWAETYRWRVPLVVVHTKPEDRAASLAIQARRPTYYLPHSEAGGQDIAALRCLILNPPTDDWDHLFWCTDDVLPMRYDFLEPFIEGSNRADLVGMHLFGASPTGGPLGRGFNEHVRTVCFLIRREVAERLTFPESKAGKKGCWKFEHGPDNMTLQVRRLGYKVTSIYEGKPQEKEIPIQHHYLWDSGADFLYTPDRSALLWDRFSTTWRIPPEE